MRLTEYGPPHLWFAWRPVDTHDQGTKWLRRVWRQRRWRDVSGLHTSNVVHRWWSYTTTRPRGVVW